MCVRNAWNDLWWGGEGGVYGCNCKMIHVIFMLNNPPNFVHINYHLIWIDAERELLLLAAHRWWWHKCQTILFINSFNLILLSVINFNENRHRHHHCHRTSSEAMGLSALSRCRRHRVTCVIFAVHKCFHWLHSRISSSPSPTLSLTAAATVSLRLNGLIVTDGRRKWMLTQCNITLSYCKQSFD